MIHTFRHFRYTPTLFTYSNNCKKTVPFYWDGQLRIKVFNGIVLHERISFIINKNPLPVFLGKDAEGRVGVTHYIHYLIDYTSAINIVW